MTSRRVKPYKSSAVTFSTQGQKAQENHKSTSWAMRTLLLIIAYPFIAPLSFLYLYKMPTCIWDMKPETTHTICEVLELLWHWTYVSAEVPPFLNIRGSGKLDRVTDGRLDGPIFPEVVTGKTHSLVFFKVWSVIVVSGDWPHQRIYDYNNMHTFEKWLKTLSH